MGKIDQLMLLDKFETVVRCINRIKSKIPKSIEDFLTDLDAQDIIILNLERASQATVDIAAHIISTQNLRSADSLSQSHVVLFENGILSQKTSVRMQKAVGMRKLFVHEYANIEWPIVWQIINHHISDYIDFISEIQSWTQLQK